MRGPSGLSVIPALPEGASFTIACNGGLHQGVGGVFGGVCDLLMGRKGLFMAVDEIDYDRMTVRKRVRAVGELAAAMPVNALRGCARPEQRLIFTVTNGRTGSDMLHTLFTAFDGLTSTHEPEPDFRHLRPYAARYPALARRWLKHIKLPAIAALPGEVYVETSHMFCKGWIEPMLDLGQKFDLVMLHRPAREVALSMSRLPAVPGSGPWAECFYLSPDEPGFLTLPKGAALSDYQICYWHALENAKRQAHYTALAAERGLRTARIATGSLSDEGAVLGLFEDLGMDMDRLNRERLAGLLTKRVNLKQHEKREAKPDMALVQDEEAAVLDLLGEAAA